MTDITRNQLQQPPNDMERRYRDMGDGTHAPVQAVALLDPNNLSALQAIPIDEAIGALVTIDGPHHEVHEGDMFHVENLFTSVGNNASADLLLTTGADEAHAVFSVAAGGAARIFLYEAPTTSGGTALPAYNMRRSSSHTALSSVVHTPTVTATGSTVLVARLLPGGNSNPSRVGGGTRSGVEWLLAPNTKYLLRVTNVSGSAVDISIALEFYEE